MKIVFLGTAYPYRGGLANFNERLAYEFQSIGHDVEIINFSLQYPHFLFPGKTQFSDAPAPQGLKIHRWINSLNPFNWILTAIKIKRLKPDIIVLKFWLPFMGLGFGSILHCLRIFGQKAKIVCILDNLIPHEKRLGDRVLTKYFISAVDEFLTMSQEVSRQCKNFPINKKFIETVHPLYDNYGERVERQDACKELNLPTNRKILLFFGFIRKYKGLDWFLLALKNLQELYVKNNISEPLPLFVVAGEFYDKEENYRELIDELLPQGNLVLHTHFISNDKVKYYFSAADLMIQSYIRATQSGVIPLAYHFEVPMLVTRVGSLADYVPDNKIGLVAEPNVEDITQKILQFLKMDSQQFKGNFKEEKLKYSWKVLAELITAKG